MTNKPFKVQAVANLLGTTVDTVRRLEVESGIEVERQQSGPKTRLFTVENVYELSKYRHSKTNKPKRKKPVILTTYAPKGGVGKTTIASNLACIFPLLGLRTLVVDLDFQSNLTLAYGYDSELSHEDAEILGIPQDQCIDYHFGNLFSQWPTGVTPLKDVLKKPFGEHGPHLIPSDLTLDRLDTMLTLDTLEGKNADLFIARLLHQGISGNNPAFDLSDYDLIIFDAAPAKNRITRGALLASDFVLAPVSMEKYSTKAVSYLSSVLQEMQENVGRYPELIILGNFFDQTKVRVASQVMALTKEYNDAWLDKTIRRSEDFPKTLSSEAYEMPLFLSKPSSNGAIELRGVAESVLKKMRVG